MHRVLETGIGGWGYFELGTQRRSGGEVGRAPDFFLSLLLFPVKPCFHGNLLPETGRQQWKKGYPPSLKEDGQPVYVCEKRVSVHPISTLRTLIIALKFSWWGVGGGLDLVWICLMSTTYLFNHRPVVTPDIPDKAGTKNLSLYI